MIIPPSGYSSVGPPESPVDWLSYLYGKVTENAEPRERYTKYYEGEHQELAFAQAKYREEFYEVFRNWRDNFCGLVIDSVNERLVVDGFRTDVQGGIDQEAKEFWQRSSMDVFSNAVHLDAMVHGQSFVLVWPERDTGEPNIIPISAENMAVQYKPGSMTELEAAARFYLDSWGRQWVTLWTETYIYEVLVKKDGTGETDWENGKLHKNPFGVVPVVPFNNRFRLAGAPYSDLANIIPIQDAINKIVSDAITASEFAAYPQRYVTGLEIMEDENGNPVEPFNVAVDKILQAEDPAAKFGQFQAADLGNYTNLIGMLVQHMASISKTPPHYFLVNGGNAPSGEAIISAEAGLVAKVRERMLHFGEAWERVIRLCFAIKGDDRADSFSMETIWRDPEYRTEAQHIDALLKLKQLNVPEEQLWSDAGYSPTQIERFREMRKDDAKAAKEIQELGPQDSQPGFPGQAGGPPPGDKKAAVMAAKAPQGNSGNVNRKLNETK